ncbi:hypothetical protein ACOSQ3_014039 [Xanthoceras sorbifolium]
MTGIDLSSNELTGNVPSKFGYLRNIYAVNLSHNFLSGSIPKSFSHLKNVESLDLSHNKLSGRIPPQLTELTNLGTFNVTLELLMRTLMEETSVFVVHKSRGVAAVRQQHYP